MRRLGSKGKVAIMTGEGSGIGKAVAFTLLRSGYSVALQASASELFGRTKQRFGPLDRLFSNGGTNAPGLAHEDLIYEQWKNVVNVNLTGVFLLRSWRPWR